MSLLLLSAAGQGGKTTSRPWPSLTSTFSTPPQVRQGTRSRRPSSSEQLAGAPQGSNPSLGPGRLDLGRSHTYSTVSTFSLLCHRKSGPSGGSAVARLSASAPEGRPGHSPAGRIDSVLSSRTVGHTDPEAQVRPVGDVCEDNVQGPFIGGRTWKALISGLLQEVKVGVGVLGDTAQTADPDLFSTRPRHGYCGRRPRTDPLAATGTLHNEAGRTTKRESGALSVKLASAPRPSRIPPLLSPEAR